MAGHLPGFPQQGLGLFRFGAHVGFQAESLSGSAGFGGSRLAGGLQGCKPLGPRRVRALEPGPPGVQGGSAAKTTTLYPSPPQRPTNSNKRTQLPLGVGEGYLQPNWFSRGPQPGERREEKGHQGEWRGAIPVLPAATPTPPRALPRSPGRGRGRTVLENYGPLAGLRKSGRGWGLERSMVPGMRVTAALGSVGVSGETTAPTYYSAPSPTPRPPSGTFERTSWAGEHENGSTGRERAQRALGRRGCGAWERDSGGEERRGRPGKRLEAAGGATPGRRRGAGQTKVSEPAPPPYPPRPNPGRVSATPAPTPRLAQPARLLRRRGLGRCRPAPFENGSISGYRALKGVSLKGLVGKDKSERPHSADQSKALNGNIKRRPNQDYGSNR